ncbi:hypothetical protein EV426DRAFT_699773 [Tirmania nivea]|nr:hypothetical protein EV426DRAFT_699773 [Tirmania nivea]
MGVQGMERKRTGKDSRVHRHLGSIKADEEEAAMMGRATYARHLPALRSAATTSPSPAPRHHQQRHELIGNVTTWGELDKQIWKKEGENEEWDAVEAYFAYFYPSSDAEGDDPDPEMDAVFLEEDVRLDGEMDPSEVEAWTDGPRAEEVAALAAAGCYESHVRVVYAEAENRSR